MKKAGFIVVAALVCAACQSSQHVAETRREQRNANPAADFRREANRDGGITITFYEGQSKTVVIPGSIDGKPVTAIGDWAFSDNKLTGLTIPNSVTAIGDYAFSDNKLTGLTIPDSVTAIGDGAFRRNQLTGVTIPNSVTAIGERAFWNNQLTGLTIPDSVAAIGDAAFAENQLTGVTIGANVAGASGAFGNDFQQAYHNNGAKAGTYTLNGGSP